MSDNQGVPASPSGHSATPEPVVSALRASVPNAWQPIETAPMHTRILVAYHGRGHNIVDIVERTGTTGHWGDYNYINSHYGEPKYWMPLPESPNDIAGPDCGCDGCTEEYYGQDD